MKVPAPGKSLGSEGSGRFGELYSENVPLTEIISTVRPLLEMWARAGRASESFGDFYSRWFGSDERPHRLVPCEAVPARERIEREIKNGEPNQDSLRAQFS